MALMLTFFVMLFAMSNPKQEDWQDFQQKVQKQFNKFYGQPLNRGQQDDISIEKVNLNQALDLNYLRELIDKQLEQQKDLSVVRLMPQPGTLLMSLPEDLLFEPGSSAVSDEGAKALYAIAQLLDRFKNRIEVMGHADPRPVTGGEYASNWELSLSRAAFVAATLENYGYSRPITVRGYSSGRYDDIPSSIPTEGRLSLSRRVDIAIMADDGKRLKSFEFQ